MNFEDFVYNVRKLDEVEKAKEFEVLIEKRVDVMIKPKEGQEAVEELVEEAEDISCVRTKEFEDGKICTYSVEKSD